MLPKRSTVRRVRSCSTSSSKPRARPEPELTEISCNMRRFFFFPKILPTFIQGHVNLRDMVADDANVIHVRVVTRLCDLTSTVLKEGRASICHFNVTMQGWAVASIVSDLRTGRNRDSRRNPLVTSNTSEREFDWTKLWSLRLPSS